MSDQRVIDMTLEELQQFVENIIDKRLEVLYQQKNERTVEEILESLRRNRWTPPPGTPSTLEMLREDRDR